MHAAASYRINQSLLTINHRMPHCLFLLRHFGSFAVLLQLLLLLFVCLLRSPFTVCRRHIHYSVRKNGMLSILCLWIHMVWRARSKRTSRRSFVLAFIGLFLDDIRSSRNAITQLEAALTGIISLRLILTYLLHCLDGLSKLAYVILLVEYKEEKEVGSTHVACEAELIAWPTTRLLGVGMIKVGNRRLECRASVRFRRGDMIPLDTWQLSTSSIFCTRLLVFMGGFH